MVVKKKDLKKAHFCGTREELSEAFDKLGLSDVVFTHMLATEEDGRKTGFVYATCDPNLTGTRLLSKSIGKDELVESLALALEHAELKIPILVEYEHKVWMIRLFMKKKDILLLADVAAQSNPTIESQSLSQAFH
jgi:hypothetical protein